MKHTINLVVGDWSGDGHRETSTVTIRSNLSTKAIAKAYKVGSKKLGVDLTEDVASDYEDKLITKDIWEKFTSHGLTLEKVVASCDWHEEELSKYNGFNLDCDAFVLLYLFVIELGDPSFKYTFEENSTINIGGYGLFNC